MTASLTSRQRVVRALNHEDADRIPIDLGGSSNSLIHVDAHQALAATMGLSNLQGRLQSMMTQGMVPDERIREAFGADVILIDPGAPDRWKLHIDPETGRYGDEWGVQYHRPPGTYYYEYYSHPLKEGTLAELNQYPWPDPHDPGRYRGVGERVRALYEGTDKALLVNNPFGIFEHSLALRGMENALSDLVLRPEFAEALADQLLEWQKIYWEETLTRIGQFVQVVKINDDLGWQDGTLISPRTYRRLYKPRHRALIQCIRRYTDAKIYIHSDGDIFPFLNDFAEIGIDILNPVEVTARDMDSARLKSQFGDRFSFWGGSCGNVVLTQGTPADIEAEVRRRIKDFAPGGGYIFASIHSIQPNVPPENIAALFNAALKWGRFPIVA